MRFSSLLLITLTTVCASSLVATLTAPAGEASPSVTSATYWKVDPVHSSVLFKVKHYQGAYFYGRFAKFEGSFVFDPENLGDSEVVMEVEAESVDTRSEGLDKHLRSPDFFDARQFPNILFESTKVKKGKGNVLKVTGDLTLHGVTKSITIEVEHTGTGKGRRGPVAGFHTSFTIDRTDFGVSYGTGGIGSDVELIISIEAGQG